MKEWPQPPPSTGLVSSAASQRPDFIRPNVLALDWLGFLSFMGGLCECLSRSAELEVSGNRTAAALRSAHWHPARAPLCRLGSFPPRLTSPKLISSGSWKQPPRDGNQTSLHTAEQAELGLRWFWKSSDCRYFIHWNGAEVLNVTVKCDVNFISLFKRGFHGNSLI